MANIRLIKRRIRVARNISQITKAMEMVSASKMKKAQEVAVAGKPYAQKIFQATLEFVKKIKIDPESYPLLRQENNSTKFLVVMISTNKGLCGGLNTNLFRLIISWFPERDGVDFITLGKKGESFVIRTGRHLIADFSDSPFLDSVGALTNLLVLSFLKQEYKEIWLVYNDFFSVLKQSPVKKIILPIKEIRQTGEMETGKQFGDFLIEPSIEHIMTVLLPRYLEIQVREAILESEASEHSARMMAMKSATDNATELMGELTLDYNRARQQLITYEISDIVTAREAMSGVN